MSVLKPTQPLLVSSGEPAGIGPDLCLELAALGKPLVILADKDLLIERAKQLHKAISFIDYTPHTALSYRPGQLHVLSVPCGAPVKPGELDVRNAAYVLEMLELAVSACLSGEFAGLVTAPVHKGIINQSGISFTGHTEFLADRCGVSQVVMLLASQVMKVALVTTHLPLKKVSEAITPELIDQVVHLLHAGLQRDFGIRCPRILVAGLNPHAGEGGYLGREEIDTIIPALQALRAQGIDARGPFPADTMFTPHYLADWDAFLTMYHDQGLPVLKYSGFGDAVNVTLGLPIVRTSVDHGTALELAGTNKASSGSLLAAVDMAQMIVNHRIQ